VICRMSIIHVRRPASAGSAPNLVRSRSYLAFSPGGDPRDPRWGARPPTPALATSQSYASLSPSPSYVTLSPSPSYAMLSPATSNAVISPQHTILSPSPSFVTYSRSSSVASLGQRVPLAESKRVRAKMVPRSKKVVRTVSRPYNNFVHPEEPVGGRPNHGQQRWRLSSREASKSGWATARQMYEHDDWWRSAMSSSAVSGNDRRARARHHGTYDARVEAGGISHLEAVSYGDTDAPLRRTKSNLADANSFHPNATLRLHEHRYGTYDQRDLSVLQLLAHEYGIASTGTYRTLERRVLEHEAGIDRAPNEFRGRGHNW